MSFKIKIEEPVIDLSADPDFILQDMFITQKLLEIRKVIVEGLRAEGKTEEEIERILSETRFDVIDEEGKDKRFIVH